MKKIFLFILLSVFLFASNIKELNNINELEDNKNIFLMFSTSYCPWCAKQTKVLKKLQEKRKNFQFIKVKDDSAVYKELLKKYAFVIEVYPTSYLVYKKDDIININYEFQGYQKEKNILDVIDDKDNF